MLKYFQYGNSKVKRQKIEEEFNEKIDKISKMNAFKYLRHIYRDEEEENDSDSATIADNIEQKIYNLEKLIHENKEIKYRSLFV